MFWDVTQGSLLETYGRTGGEDCGLYLIVYDFPRPTLTQHVTPKRRYILTILHGVMVFFVVTVMRTPNFSLASHVSIIYVGDVLPKLLFSL